MSGSANTNPTGNLQRAASSGGNGKFTPASTYFNVYRHSTLASLDTPVDTFVARPAPPPAPAGANIAVWNILCDGPFTIDIAAESSTPQANPERPQFLKGIAFNAGRENEWNGTVLPYIRLLTFTIASTTDVFFVGAMLKALPNLANNILKVDMNGFHWFSGISDNRRSNPFIVLSSNLPSLRDMYFTLHTSMITDSKWGERQLLELERTNPDRAKERRVRTVAEVMGRYDMEQIFSSRALEQIRLVYIKSDMVTAFIVEGNPEVVLANIRNWLVQGFRKHGREVVVKLSLAA